MINCILQSLKQECSEDPRIDQAEWIIDIHRQQILYSFYLCSDHLSGYLLLFIINLQIIHFSNSIL